MSLDRNAPPEVAHVDDLIALIRDEEDRADLPAYDAGSRRETEVAARIGAEYLRGQFIAVGQRLWYKWDGRRFKKLDSDAPVYSAVRAAVNDIAQREIDAANEKLKEAMRRAEDLPPDEQKGARRSATDEHAATMKWVNSLFNIGRLRSFMLAAREMVTVAAEELDTRHDLLNVANGVVDLQTGELLPHDPEYLFTKVSETAYRPHATHRVWSEVISAIPTAYREDLRMRFGWALTGYTPSDDIVPFLYGGGANGKSTLLDGIIQAAGEFATLIPQKVLLGNTNDHPTEFMTLRGARLAYLEELPEGDYLNGQALKRIMGTGQITARYIGENSVTWTPTHSLFITTNHEVKVDAVDYGLRRRLAKFDFPYRYVDDPQGPDERQADPAIREAVRNDPEVAEAALAWAVVGAILVYERGGTLPPLPADVAEATDEWWQNANQAIRFLNERFEPDPEACVLVADVFREFQVWAEDRGRKGWTDQTFWQRAVQHPWFADGTAERPPSSVRLGRRKVSQPGGQFTQMNKKARVVLGIRFAEDAE